MEPGTVSEAVELIFNATARTDISARVAFDDLMEAVLNRQLTDAQKENAWYTYLGMFV